MTATRGRRAALVPTLLLAVVGLAACSGDEPGETSPSTGADGLTAPGTALDVGETARVTRNDASGTVELTVLDVEEGDPADLAAIGFERADEVTPYYLHVDVEPVSGSSEFGLDEYLNVRGGGEPLDHLTVLEPFTPCQEVAVAADDLGEKREHCVVYVAENGAPRPDRVYFVNSDDYDAVDDGAVEWEIPPPGRT
ncbi:hypothetical protein ABFT23_13800 [Nocardioides sp. C4-1]|uniref:hypothetical protein n=1 Tax=Nocardioides sp. C4-1 TaxID=3151851 RepID=UPI0032631983